MSFITVQNPWEWALVEDNLLKAWSAADSVPIKLLLHDNVKGAAAEVHGHVETNEYGLSISLSGATHPWRSLDVVGFSLPTYKGSQRQLLQAPAHSKTGAASKEKRAFRMPASLKVCLILLYVLARVPVHVKGSDWSTSTTVDWNNIPYDLKNYRQVDGTNYYGYDCAGVGSGFCKHVHDYGNYFVGASVAFFCRPPRGPHTISKFQGLRYC